MHFSCPSFIFSLASNIADSALQIKAPAWGGVERTNAAEQSKPPGFSSSVMLQAINLAHYLPAWAQLSATVL